MLSLRAFEEDSALVVDDLNPVAIVACWKSDLSYIHAALRVPRISGLISTMESDGGSVRRDVHVARAVDGLVGSGRG